MHLSNVPQPAELKCHTASNVSTQLTGRFIRTERSKRGQSAWGVLVEGLRGTWGMGYLLRCGARFARQRLDVRVDVGGPAQT